MATVVLKMTMPSINIRSVGAENLGVRARRRVPASRSANRGFSMIEAMIGIAVSLAVALGAVFMASTQLISNNRLLLEIQMNQDLRAQMDFISRIIARGGMVGEATLASSLISSNSVASATYSGDVSNTSSGFQVSYLKDADVGGFYANGSLVPTDTPGTLYKYWLKLDNYAIYYAQGYVTATTTPGWSLLSNPNLYQITAFTITPSDANTNTIITVPCDELCADGTSSCWPKSVRRYYTVAITARAIYNTNIQISVSRSVMVRNDIVTSSLPVISATPNATQLCPTR